MQEKETAKDTARARPASPDIEAATPEKEEGPARPPAQRAAQPASRIPPAQAAAMLATPQPTAGTAGQARAMNAAQQSVGNLRAGRLAQGGDKGWSQGGLDDFNGRSQPGSRSWQQARAYYWLQQQGKVKEIYVKVLAAGKGAQFIFDADSIERYYATHPLPAEVPLYE
jgi:hypothetical protein